MKIKINSQLSAEKFSSAHLVEYILWNVSDKRQKRGLLKWYVVGKQKRTTNHLNEIQKKDGTNFNYSSLRPIAFASILSLFLGIAHATERKKMIIEQSLT